MKSGVRGLVMTSSGQARALILLITLCAPSSSGRVFDVMMCDLICSVVALLGMTRGPPISIAAAATMAPSLALLAARPGFCLIRGLIVFRCLVWLRRTLYWPDARVRRDEVCNVFAEEIVPLAS